MTAGQTVTKTSAIREFLQLEAASGILLVAAGLLAVIAANSPLSAWYTALLDLPLRIQLGGLELHKPLLLWVNDLLMAIFFVLVGLEIKREVVTGELSEPARIALPAIAAVGGMVVPAVVYAALNASDPTALRGWAIPSATDIAFALGLLSLFGSRVPLGLKVFLMTLAVLDDLGAIVIIALFYTSQLSWAALTVAVLAVIVLAVMNFAGVMRSGAYLLVGALLWIAVLKSGVHATLAGVVTALFVPARNPVDPQHAPLATLEHSLHPWVAFGILPVFAFANAGVSLAGLSLRDLLEPVPLGIALGLFVGKQVGVFVFAWLAITLRVARVPAGVTLPQIYGVSILCGIGFTMSLFIGSLAFKSAAPGLVFNDRLGILVGSLLSAAVGYVVMQLVLPKAPTAAES